MNTSNFGFLVIDKPAGITSHDCVNRLRHIFGLKRIGHGGTLDPAVTGVLPIAVGKATRLLSFLPSGKRYEGTIKLGIRTNTDDLEGETISKQAWPKLENDHIKNILSSFTGNINQYPPVFSSVHIGGERAYKRARRGELFELTPKEVTIYEIELLNWNQITGEINIRINCSSGTYIRSLARDIGEKIGCGASLSKLRRTESLGFKINNAISLPEFSKNEDSIKPDLINPIQVLTHMSNIFLTEEEEKLYWCKGNSFHISSERINSAKCILGNEHELRTEFITVTNQIGYMIGVAIWSKEQLRIQPKIVFNAEG